MEPFSKSDKRVTLVEVPTLAFLSSFAAKLAHQAISDPLCGTPRKAIPLVLTNISWKSWFESRSCAMISAFLTTIPPKLWHIKTIGLDRPPGAVGDRLALRWLRSSRALSSILATDLLNATVESYPKVMIRACGISAGKTSRSHREPLSCSHVLYASPCNPWTATTSIFFSHSLVGSSNSPSSVLELWPQMLWLERLGLCHPVVG